MKNVHKAKMLLSKSKQYLISSTISTINILIFTMAKLVDRRVDLPAKEHRNHIYQVETRNRTNCVAAGVHAQTIYNNAVMLQYKVCISSLS